MKTNAPSIRNIAPVLAVIIIAVVSPLADNIPANVLAAALIAVCFAGARVVLGSTAAAAIAVSPLLIVVPWRSEGGIWYMAAFSLAAAVTWAACLAISKREDADGSAPVLAASAAVAFGLSPQSLVFVVIATAAFIWKARGRRRAMLVLAVAAALGAVFAAKGAWLFWSGSGRAVLEWREILFMPSGIWNLPAWEGERSAQYTNMMLRFGGSFHWPVAAAALALALPYRRLWWFAPTFAGAVLLAAGAHIYGGNVYFQYSLPLEMAFLIPLGIVGVLSMRGITGGLSAEAVNGEKRESAA